MSQIGVLAASSAGLFNLDYLPERLLLSSPASQGIASNLSVVCSGRQLMSVTSANRINALAKFDMNPDLGNDLIGSWIRLAPSRVNRASTINITNAIAAPQDVYASSTSKGNVARTAVEQTINASANQTFTEFEALFFSFSNVLRVNLTFADGFNDDYSPQELGALFLSLNPSETSGYLDGLICIKSDMPGDNDVVQAVIYTTSGGNVTVLKTSYVVL